MRRLGATVLELFTRFLCPSNRAPSPCATQPIPGASEVATWRCRACSGPYRPLSAASNCHKRCDVWRPHIFIFLLESCFCATACPSALQRNRSRRHPRSLLCAAGLQTSAVSAGMAGCRDHKRCDVWRPDILLFTLESCF